MYEDDVIHDHSIHLHNLIEAGEAVYVELEGQAAHERLQVALGAFKKALVDAKVALSPIMDEVADLKAAVAAKRAADESAAYQKRHDDHNADSAPAQVQSKSPSGPAPATPAAAGPEPPDPSQSGGTVQ